MAIVPGVVVPAPEQLRRRYGLFDAASGPLDLPAHGEGGGVRFVPVACGSAVPIGVTCYEPGAAPVKPLSGDTAEIVTGVFVVLSTLNCGAVGYTTAEYEAKVRRRLEASEQATVEEALWTGLDYADAGMDTLSLDGEASNIPAGYDPGLITDVVGALENYAYTDQQYGGVAYIHAPVEVAAFAAEAGLIVPEGTGPNARKLTPMGSVWVFGAYPSGEVIVTGQTTVWRAPEIQVHSSFENATNEVVLVAERAYSVAFECFAGRAEFNPLSGSALGGGGAVALTGSDQVVSASPVDYRGFTLRETTGTTQAVIRIFDNASAASGTVLEEVVLLPGESAREWYDPGIPAQNGVYVDVVSGTVTGSVRVG